MELSWLDKLKKLVEKKPLVILKFDDNEWESLHNSRRGVNEFTIARSHQLLQRVKPSAPCLMLGKSDGRENLYFGLISSRSAVTTLESRIKIRRGLKIKPQSTTELLNLITKKVHAKSLQAKLHEPTSVITLTPKLSSHLIETLASISSNHGAMRAAVESLTSPKIFQGPASFQEDALHTALKAFGLTPNDQAFSLELVEGRETALARVAISEDSVIEHDARYIPGYDLVKSDLTGRAVFKREDEQLEVFTANRRPLEHVFGVDLIYFNETRENIVMLQYKMLEPFRADGDDWDWVYRPDRKMENEIRRMRKFAADHRIGPHEYRLNSAVFYLKFVKRDASISGGSIIMPIEHYERIRNNPACRGPRNGFRVSYDSLSGRYLRQKAFLDLIRSGYIGAHAEKTAHLKKLIEAVLNSNRGVVAAIQRMTEPKFDRDNNFEDPLISDMSGGPDD